MRLGVCAAAAACALAAAGSARAQASGATTLLGGPPPSAIQFTPIDMSNLVVAPAMSAQQQRFSFAALVRRLTFSATPTMGVSALPQPSTFPSYPSAQMVGTPPYKLGDPRAAKNPFQPSPPILNSTATGR